MRYLFQQIDVETHQNGELLSGVPVKKHMPDFALVRKYLILLYKSLALS